MLLRFIHTVACIDTSFLCTHTHIKEYVSPGAVASSHGNSTANFVRSPQAVLQVAVTLLHPHQQCTRAATSRHPGQQLLSSALLKV